MDTALFVIAFFGFAYLGSLLMDHFIKKMSIKSILHLLGAEYIFLGILLGPVIFNLINESMLIQLKPIIGLGIGWVGLLFGTQINFSNLRRFPAYNIGLSLIQSFGAFVFVALFLIGWAYMTEIEGKFFSWQPLIILSAAAAPTSPIVIGYLRKRISAKDKSASLIYFISSIDGIWAIIPFGVAYALVMPMAGQMASWVIDLIRVLMALAIGAILGYFFRILLRFKYTRNEFLVIMIGLVVLTSGSASYLGLSPLFINFIVGVVIANTIEKKSQVQEALVVYEKIFYIIFLILAGSMWVFPGKEAMILGLIYIVTRAVGKWVGFFSGYIMIDSSKRQGLSKNIGWAFLPQGGLVLAMAIDYKGHNPGVYADIILNTIIISVVVSHLFGPSLIKLFINTDEAK